MLLRKCRQGEFLTFSSKIKIFQIKFLQSKPDTAMVQMANRREANNVMQYLNGVSVFGTRLSISLSKQSILHNNSEAFTMPNGWNLMSFYMYSLFKVRALFPILRIVEIIVFQLSQVHSAIALYFQRNSFISLIFL